MEAGRKDGLMIDVKSSEITERRMYVQLTFDGLDAEFPVNRHGQRVGEVIKAGLVLKNSEIGYGCREINFLAFTLACTKGLILPRTIGSFTTRHIGGRQGNGNIFALSSGNPGSRCPRLCPGDP
jgi:hypothetical protein